VRTTAVRRLTLIAALAAMALTLLVAWHGSPLPGDSRITRDVQDIDPLRRNEGWLNALGTLPVEVSIVLLAVIALAAGPGLGLEGTERRRTAAIWTLVAALALRLLGDPLKQIALSPRPSAEDGVRILHHFSGYGFPSGHVYGDVVIYGALAAVASTVSGRAAGAAIRVLCVAVIVLSGPARVVVGAHWPSDCLGGYLSGATALGLALLAGSRLGSPR
jgi:undecaprenyl-diphosphatase